MGDEEGLNRLDCDKSEIERILQKAYKILNQSKGLLIIHPKAHEQLSQKDKDFLKDNFSIILSSCIEPTEVYVSKDASLLNYPVDYWEEM